MARSRIRKFLASTLPVLLVLVLLFAALYLAADATTSESGLGDYYEAVFWLAGVTLVLLALMIVLRVVKLVRRARRAEPGSRLTLRLVTMFVLLTVPPAVVVYWFSIDFLRRGIDSWFDTEVYSAMGDARDIGTRLLQLQERQYGGQVRNLAARLVNLSDAETASRLRALRLEAGAQDMLVIDENGRVLAAASEELNSVPDLPSGFVRLQARSGQSFVETEGSDDRRQIRALAQIDDDDLRRTRLLQGVFPVTSVDQQVENIDRMTDKMNQLAFLRDNLKRSFLLILSLVLLLSVLLAVLLAFNTARRLVNPIGRLSSATRSIAAGDYDRRLDVPKQNDELGFLVQSFNQMTDQIKRASAAAESSRQEAETRRDYLETLLGRLSSGVVSIDADRRILTANEAAAEILDVPTRALRHLPLRELPQRSIELQGFVQLIVDHHEDRGEWREQVHLLRASGEQILMLRGAPLETGQGGQVVVFNDLTDLVQAQREAAWGEVARRLAHEVKNPLTPIQLSAERLRHKYLDEMSADKATVLDKATRTIVAQVEALKKLVDAFSEYARAPAVKRQPLKVSELAEEVLTLYESNACRVERHWLDDEPPVPVDPDRIRQLLHNLIKNAMEAVGDDSVVLRLSTRIETNGDARLVLSVADNGPGLPAELRPRMFEPYATNKPRGSGLGLAIVKKIAEEHGARITAFNHEQGGACFELSLPLGQAQVGLKIAAG